MTDGILQSHEGTLLLAGGKLATDCCCGNSCEDWINPPENWPTAAVNISGGGGGTVIFNTFQSPAAWSSGCWWIGTSTDGYTLYLAYDEGVWKAAYLSGTCIVWRDTCNPSQENLSVNSGFGQNYYLPCSQGYPPPWFNMIDLPAGTMQISNGKISGVFSLPGFSPLADCQGGGTNCPQNAGLTATFTISQS